jgi:hypothetical protein
LVFLDPFKNIYPFQFLKGKYGGWFTPCRISKMRKSENTKSRPFVFFSFSHFRGNKAKIRQKEGENTTHKICRIFAAHLSYFRFLALLHFLSLVLLHICIVTFSHFRFFPIVTFSHFRVPVAHAHDDINLKIPKRYS